jgi:hypothetical protein
MRDGRLEEVPRGETVDLLVEDRLRERRAHPGAGREVDHRVEALLGEEPEDELAVADVALDEPVTVLAFVRRDVGALERGIVEVVEVVEHDDAVAASAPAVGHVRADEAGSAGDEESHCAGDPGAGVGVRER